MNNIKGWNDFINENFSDEKKEVLENPENNFIVICNDKILGGNEFLEDSLKDVLKNYLVNEFSFTEEEEYEYDDIIDDKLAEYGFEPSEISQEDLDDILKEIFEKLNLTTTVDLEDGSEIKRDINCRVVKRDTLEEMSDVDPEAESDFDLDDEPYDPDIEEFLENNKLNEDDEEYKYVIIGDYKGKEEEIDYAKDEEEANYLTNQYKVAFNKHEGWDNIRFKDYTSINEEIIHNEVTCECGDNCSCEGNCKCGDDCECEKCDELKDGSDVANNDIIKSFEKFYNK